MTTIGEVESGMKVNKWAVLFQLGLLVISLSAFGLWLRYQDPMYFAPVMALLGIYLTWAMWPVLCLLVSGTALVLTNRGLVNKTGSFTFVAWDEIRGARLRRKLLLFDVIELDLRDTEPMLQRLGVVRRYLMRSYLNKYQGKPTIQVSFVQVAPEMLLDTILQKIRASNVAV